MFDLGDPVTAEQVNLKDAGISPVMREVRETYTGVYKNDAPNLLRRHDYQRWSYVLDQIDGGSILDVGMGVGQFVYGASATGRFSKIVGVDIKPHSQLLYLDDTVEFVWANAADLPFDDNSFDAVTCMECLEHLDDDTLEGALSELRRVARGTLYMTVPWEEPEPLPSHHVQRFDAARIVSMFPAGRVTILDKEGSGCPWALIVERFERPGIVRRLVSRVLRRQPSERPQS